MSHSNNHYTTNILLDALSPDDLAHLKPHFVREKLNLKQMLIPANEPIEHVWFPEGGVASIVANMPDDGPTEVGIFGCDGFAGMPLLLGANTSAHEVFMQSRAAPGCGSRRPVSWPR